VLFGKKEFSQVFRVGEVVTSGAAPNRKNAAHLRILAIDDPFVRYQSLKSASKSRMRCSYLELLLDHYEDLDPKSIQKSVNRALKRAGFNADYSTENYAYSFAKAFHERTAEDIFLTQGETPVTRSFQPEVPDYTEGRRVPVMVERIERDPKARLRCIQEHGVESVVSILRKATDQSARASYTCIIIGFSSRRHEANIKFIHSEILFLFAPIAMRWLTARRRCVRLRSCRGS
jgi:hypothetical protein